MTSELVSTVKPVSMVCCTLTTQGCTSYLHPMVRPGLACTTYIAEIPLTEPGMHRDLERQPRCGKARRTCAVEVSGARNGTSNAFDMG